MIRPDFQVTADAAARRPSTPRRRPAEVQVFRIDARVWHTALQLADGDVSRIQRLSETAVRVR